MKSDEHHVPRLTLERHRLGELPPEASAALRRRLADDPLLQRQLLELERSDRELWERYPAHVVAATVREHLATPNAARLRPRAGWGAAAAAAAVAALALLPIGPESPMTPPETEPGVRIKGLTPSLALFRKAAPRAEPLADGDMAHEGDVVRLAYRAAGHAFGLILSVDGRGAVTLHLPDRGGLAAPLDADAEVPLDHAYELDDAPRWERFYFVVGDAPFEVAPVVAVARRVATQHPSRAPERLGLPPHLRQSGITLRKGDR